MDRTRSGASSLRWVGMSLALAGSRHVSTHQLAQPLPFSLFASYRWNGNSPWPRESLGDSGDTPSTEPREADEYMVLAQEVGNARSSSGRSKTPTWLGVDPQRYLGIITDGGESQILEESSLY